MYKIINNYMYEDLLQSPIRRPSNVLYARDLFESHENAADVCSRRPTRYSKERTGDLQLLNII